MAKTRLDSVTMFTYCSFADMEDIMIGYVTLGTSDLARGAAFYDAIAKELGTPRMMDTDTFIAWGKCCLLYTSPSPRDS